MVPLPPRASHRLRRWLRPELILKPFKTPIARIHSRRKRRSCRRRLRCSKTIAIRSKGTSAIHERVWIFVQVLACPRMAVQKILQSWMPTDKVRVVQQTGIRTKFIRNLVMPIKKSIESSNPWGCAEILPETRHCERAKDNCCYNRR